MLKILILVLAICSVHCWKARSWTGRDWQSNSGRRGGWGGWENDEDWRKDDDGEDDGSWKGDNNDDGDNRKWNGDDGDRKWGGNDGDNGRDQWTPAKYSFGYGVADALTGDKKEQMEERLGNAVRGQYSLKEADGTRRIVKYEADKGGFNAKVIREGTAWHPQGKQNWNRDDGMGGWGRKW